LVVTPACGARYPHNQRMTSTLPISTAPHSATLARLIERVREVVGRERDSAKVGHEVAELLKPCLLRDDFLTAEQMEPDEEGYRQHILHVEPDGSFSVVSLVWLPGQETCIHDHVSWCVVGVYRGQEHETVYDEAGGKRDPHLIVTGNHVNPAGSVAALVPPGDIHHVENAGNGLAVSIHIYGADIAKLGCSIRRRYDLEVREASAV
jgi:predicted metal-dependent enzyme (double-stranded beta helix superfamily)